MSLQIIGSNLSGTGTAVDLVTSDDLLVVAGVTVGSTDGWGVYGTGSDHDLNDLRTVTADLTAILLGDDSAADGENVIDVGTSGYVAEFGPYAVGMYSYHNSIVNRGVM